MLLTLAGLIVACCMAIPWVTARSPAAGVVALLCLFGATAVGWNGVYLATVARVAPPGQAAAATAGALFFTFFGVVLGPPVFGMVGGLIGGLGPAFALFTLPLAAAVWILRRARWG